MLDSPLTLWDVNSLERWIIDDQEIQAQSNAVKIYLLNCRLLVLAISICAIMYKTLAFLLLSMHVTIQ